MSALADRPDIAERYASATSSGNLTPKLTGLTDADLLLAAGAAAQRSPERRLALAAYRIQLRGDMEGLSVVVDGADAWLQGRLSRGGRRPLPRDARRQLVVDTLLWWTNPICGYCNGTGFVEATVEDTDEAAGRLTTEACSCCHGSGRRPLAREVPPKLREHAEWMATQLDRHVSLLRADMARLLGVSDVLAR